jgi:hypothetical protein
MIRFFRIAFASVLLAAALWGTSAAEITFSVNDNNTGVFDQPSVVLNGSVANVAYIGGSGTAGPFTVFFAAVNGGADFTNLLLPRDTTVLPIPPVAIDNTGAGGNAAYFDARHPTIALRTATEAVILFQARPSPADVVYRPYIARLALASASATLISVRQVTGFPAGELSTGDIEDISFNLVLTDNTARMAFASRSTISAATPFHVYFARVGLDDAAVVGTPLLLSSGNDDTVTGSDGFRPVPNLKLDLLGNSHIAWAANDSTPDPGGVYYAMVASTAAVDNVGIGATEVLGRTLSWGHPSVLVLATNSVNILAGDESFPGRAGSIGLVTLNPDAVVPKSGLPVSIGLVRSFLVSGPSVLPSTFDLYRPEAFLDASARIHMTGYGASGSSATYYVMRLAAIAPFAEFVTVPAPVGLNEFPAELPGDYTKAAFRFLNGKTIVFWSGLIPGSANRNLNVTTVQAVFDVPAADESGCQVVADPRSGESGRIPGTALLFLPAAALAIRRFSQGCRRKPRRSVAE